MADNVQITAGTGTYVATDDVSSVHYQRVKLDAGTDGAATPVIAGQQLMAASLPVVLASNQTVIAVSLPVKALTTISGTKAGSGVNELVAAPVAGTRIVVCAFVIQLEGTTATTMILRNGAADAWRCLAQAQGDGLVMNFPAGYEWRLTAATALNLNLSGAYSCGYSVSYYTETV